MDGVGTDKAKHRYARDQDGITQTGDLCKAAAAKKADTQHKELDQHKARKERIGHRSILAEELRAGGQALNNEAAHQYCRDRLARNTKCQRRDQGAACNGVVCCFRARHSFDRAFTEHFLMLAELSGRVIPQEAGNRGTCTGQNADQVADNPGTENSRPQDTPFLTGQAHLVGELRRLRTLFDLLLCKDKHLAHGEEADQCTGCVDALGKIAARHEALNAGYRVQTYGGDQQAQRTGHQSFDNGLG